MLLNIIVISVLILYVIILSVFAFRSGKPLKLLGINMLSGFFSLMLLSLCADYFNIELNFNIYSFSVSQIWGVCGVIMIIVTNMFF